jgi:NADH-quinone oxidoreductase subunit A
MLSEYLPVLIQICTATGLAASMLILSVLLGKSGAQPAIKNTAYECGMLPLGEGQPRFSVKFYMVAMLFVLFDIEVVFMYPWAVVFRDMAGVYPVMFWSMTSFAGILLIAYLYALKKGALNWKE